MGNTRNMMGLGGESESGGTANTVDLADLNSLTVDQAQTRLQESGLMDVSIVKAQVESVVTHWREGAPDQGAQFLLEVLSRVERSEHIVAHLIRRLLEERKVPNLEFNGMGATVREYVAGGGMGKISIARRFDTGENMAVKSAHASDDKSLARLVKEAQTLRLMSGDGVFPAFIDGGHARENWFAMQFVDNATSGEKLAEQFDEQGGAPLQFGADSLAIWLRHIAAMNAKGVVHRDLKPANMMLDAQGAYTYVDPGLVRIEGDSSVTDDGSILGTPAYMSPEQFADPHTSSTTDVYAAAASAYRMVVGRPPVEGSVTEIMKKHVQGEMPDLDVLGEGKLANALRPLFAMLLSKNAADREDLDAIEQQLFPHTSFAEQFAVHGNDAFEAFRNTHNSKLRVSVPEGLTNNKPPEERNYASTLDVRSLVTEVIEQYGDATVVGRVQGGTRNNVFVAAGTVAAVFVVMIAGVAYFLSLDSDGKSQLAKADPSAISPEGGTSGGIPADPVSATRVEVVEGLPVGAAKYPGEEKMKIRRSTSEKGEVTRVVYSTAKTELTFGPGSNGEWNEYMTFAMLGPDNFKRRDDSVHLKRHMLNYGQDDTKTFEGDGVTAFFGPLSVDAYRHHAGLRPPIELDSLGINPITSVVDLNNNPNCPNGKCRLSKVPNAVSIAFGDYVLTACQEDDRCTLLNRNGGEQLVFENGSACCAYLDDQGVVIPPFTGVKYNDKKDESSPRDNLGRITMAEEKAAGEIADLHDWLGKKFPIFKRETIAQVSP